MPEQQDAVERLRETFWVAHQFAGGGEGVEAVLAALAADPALAAAALGLEPGVETQINTPGAVTQQRDVLRYPWRTTDA